MSDTPICPDCDAERVVTEASISRRDGSRAPIKMTETVHASSCPTYRGIV